MNKSELNSKWKNIASFKNKKGYKALRITAASRPDLFLATDEDGCRCLLLFLPKKVDVKLKGTDKNKLLISFLPSKGIVLIKLKDFDFKGVRYIITSYRLTGVYKGEQQKQETKGGQFSPKMVNIIKNTKSGNSITISNIKAKRIDYKNNKEVHRSIGQTNKAKIYELIKS